MSDRFEDDGNALPAGDALRGQRKSAGPRSTAALQQRRGLAGDSRAGGAQREADRQAASGIQTIKLGDAEAAAYLAKAYQAGWDVVIRQSPQNGPKLKALFSKAR